MRGEKRARDSFSSEDWDGVDFSGGIYIGIHFDSANLSEIKHEEQAPFKLFVTVFHCLSDARGENSKYSLSRTILFDTTGVKNNPAMEGTRSPGKIFQYWYNPNGDVGMSNGVAINNYAEVYRQIEQIFIDLRVACEKHRPVFYVFKDDDQMKAAARFFPDRIMITGLVTHVHTNKYFVGNKVDDATIRAACEVSTTRQFSVRCEMPRGTMPPSYRMIRRFLLDLCEEEKMPDPFVFAEHDHIL